MASKGAKYLYVLLLDPHNQIDTYFDASAAYVGPDRMHALKAKSKLTNQAIKIPPECLHALKGINAASLRARYALADGPIYFWTDNPVTREQMQEFVDSLNKKDLQYLRRMIKP